MQKNQILPKREALSPEYKWRLEDIYESNEEWEKDVQKVKEMLKEIISFKGTLGSESKNLFQCLHLQDELLSIHDKVIVYARMRRDENNADSFYQSLTEKAFSLNTEVSSALSFITPEIISVPEEKLKKYLDTNHDLSLYRTFLNELIRQKKHILSEREEEILALSADIARNPKNVFTMFNNADIKFPTIRDENGEETELTKGRYIRFLRSPQQDVRKQAFESLHQTYASMKNTLGATLTGNMKKDRFYSLLRKYSSSMESSLDQDHVPVTVYDNLIQTISENLHHLQKYLKLRKKALNLSELHMYDLYCPIVPETSKVIPYEDAVTMVKQGLRPLGKQYLEDLDNGMSSGWIDIYENEGKTGGAYSWGAYLTHPYVLLNYQETLNDVFTLAHEMGHALHSYYTNLTQPYVYSGYSIFVAEVASTVNESLLMHYLLQKTEKKEDKAYLLNHYLEEFRGTLFRQVMFAEFEKTAHQMIGSGESLTPEDLCSMYKKLNAKYFGNEVIIDELIEMEWARIPHFYTSFYVYKYATGFSAAVSIANQILREGHSAVNRYLDFLRSGSSDYPLELLKKAGVDLTTPQPVQDALDVFGETVDELAALI